jgi:hypothetical protein
MFVDLGSSASALALIHALCRDASKYSLDGSSGEALNS